MVGSTLFAFLIAPKNMSLKLRREFQVRQGSPATLRKSFCGRTLGKSRSLMKLHHLSRQRARPILWRFKKPSAISHNAESSSSNFHSTSSTSILKSFYSSPTIRYPDEWSTRFVKFLRGKGGPSLFVGRVGKLCAYPY